MLLKICYLKRQPKINYYKKKKKIEEEQELSKKPRKFHLLKISEPEFLGEAPRDLVDNENPPNSKEPNEVRAARNKEVRQTPQRKPTTQIWHGNELPICKALCESTFSRDFWLDISILSSNLFPK